jgi:outer membrane protein
MIHTTQSLDILLTATSEVDAAYLIVVAEVAGIMGDAATAEQAYQLLVLNGPSQETRLEARFRLAVLKSNDGNLRQAAALLRQILDHRPCARRTRLELAGVLNRMGDTVAACRQLRALRSDALPGNEAQIINHYFETMRRHEPRGESLVTIAAGRGPIADATCRTTELGLFTDTTVADLRYR